MALEDIINGDIKSAMLAKDHARLRGLRAIKSALLMAKTEKGANDALTEDAELKVLQKLVKQRKESAEIYQEQKRPDLYQIEKEEQEVIESFLPQQLSKEEITVQIKQIIENSGASGMKDMGKVMGQANSLLAGKADGKTISEVVKSMLSF